jgi:hypothetical protein
MGSFRPAGCELERKVKLSDNTTHPTILASVRSEIIRGAVSWVPTKNHRTFTRSGERSAICKLARLEHQTKLSCEWMLILSEHIIQPRINCRMNA